MQITTDSAIPNPATAAAPPVCGLGQVLADAPVAGTRNFGIIFSGVESHGQGPYNIHGNCHPNPGGQGIVTVETEIEIHCRQTVMGGKVDFLENLGKRIKIGRLF